MCREPDLLFYTVLEIDARAMEAERMTDREKRRGGGWEGRGGEEGGSVGGGLVYIYKSI